MRLRLISAIILIPLALGAVLLSEWTTLAFWGIAMLLAAFEYFQMARQGGYRPLWIPILVAIAALYVDAFRQLNLLMPILVVGLAIPPLWELTRKDHDGFLLNWSLAEVGMLYFGVLGAHAFLLRNLPDGPQLLGIALMTTWVTDVFAFAFGYAFGQKSFYPTISPKKTVEGALGGILSGALFFAVLTVLVGLHPLLAFAGGLGLAIAGTAGDLVESLIKRNTGVKDSGTLIAGHGGVFDRLDSMFLTMPLAFYLFRVLISLNFF